MGIFEYKKKIMKKILLNLLLFLCVVGYSGTVMAQHKIELDIVDRSRINEDANENEVPGQMNIYQAESKDGYEVSVMLYQKKLSIIFDKRP